MRKLTLPAGDSYQLYAVVLPEDADCNVVWISEKLEIATVDQTGLVTAAKKEGKVNIIAIANGMTAVCEVTVETVTVEPETLNITIGETSSTPLTATITPYNDPYEEAVWWSEDESIAIVDGATGEVTGLSAGVVRIYATEGESAYCTVTVKSDVDIAIAPKTLNLAPDEIYNKLEVTITPPDGIDAAYTFSSANSAIATVDEFGVVTAMSDGTTKIYAATAGGAIRFLHGHGRCLYTGYGHYRRHPRNRSRGCSAYPNRHGRTC
ncbi:hypothetical protein AGMMS4957_07750 [Bacteroidia bacterium]|nr:hypothetical protein AGMMS4957_07750 [Bacteroidia bacterium]